MKQAIKKLWQLALVLSATLMLSGCIAAAGAMGAGIFAPTHEAASQATVRLARPISTEKFESLVQASATSLKYDVFSVSPSGDKITLMKKGNMAVAMVIGMHNTIEVDIVRANDRKIEISVQELGNFGEASSKSAKKIAQRFKAEITKHA